MKYKLVLALLILLFVWSVGRAWWWRSPKPMAPFAAVVVEEGSSVATIADQLKEAKLIKSPSLFKVYTKLAGRSSKLQAGEFIIYRGESVSAIVQTLMNAKTSEIQITFIEGWTLEEMGEHLVAQGVVTLEEWRQAATHDLEGYLFPDTYRFLPTVSAEEIVLKMREEMDDNITVEMEAEMDRLGITRHEMLTMASIIEREVRGDEDRKLVSDVFWKRLAIGMALQADSTVNYITGKDTPSISFADRDIDSPYNTYQNRGLPPGPISNPSLSSIEAAIYPTSNPYYFFLTDPEGTVYYAKTLEGHNLNRAQHLR